MTEQLPIINTSHNVTATKGESSSLLGRGLTAIQRKETGVVSSDLDSRYRQARDIYNRITDYGREDRFKVELLPTQEELLNEPLLQQLQPFYNSMKELVDVCAVFQELANQDYGKAYFPLFNMYRGGQGIHEDIEKSEYYQSLAYVWCYVNQISNDPEIWVDLGCLHDFDGDYNGDIDDNAYFWYRKAEEIGNARAQCNLGFMSECNLIDGGDYEQAAYWYDEAAEQDYAQAQSNLGWLYTNGFGVEKDYKQAETLFNKAAEQGYAEAQHGLGYLYETGCVDGWDNEAVHWYLKAAEQGYAKAQLKLGDQFRYAYHYYGNEINQDFKKAAFWYQRAAEQGNAQAQSNLGWMYEVGRGVDQDKEQSIFWYGKAAEQGEEVALIKLGINWQES